MSRINTQKFGIAFGIAWSLFLIIITILNYFLNIGLPLVKLIASLYKGYEASLPGVLIGTLWAFVSGYLWGLIIAYTYNKV